MKEMTDEEILEIMRDVCAYQLRGDFHPLTCGNDSNHPRLIPQVIHYSTGSDVAQKVALTCIECGWYQEHFPLDLVRKFLAEGSPEERLAKLKEQME